MFPGKPIDLIPPACPGFATVSLSKFDMPETHIPDSLWSFKIAGCPLKKNRCVTPASRLNSPIGL